MTVKTAPDRAQWLRLLGIALLIGTLVTTLEILTRERIVASQTSAALDYLRQVLGPDDHGATITFENWPIPNRQLGLLGLSEGDEMHIALRAGQPIAAIVPSISNAGYGGAIQLLVGIDLTGRIIAVRVISHRETVGLGAHYLIQPLNIGPSRRMVEYTINSPAPPSHRALWSIKWLRRCNSLPMSALRWRLGVRRKLTQRHASEPAKRQLQRLPRTLARTPRAGAIARTQPAVGGNDNLG